jgi:hypothetical protein
MDNVEILGRTNSTDLAKLGKRLFNLALRHFIGEIANMQATQVTVAMLIVTVVVFIAPVSVIITTTIVSRIRT